MIVVGQVGTPRRGFDIDLPHPSGVGYNTAFQVETKTVVGQAGSATHEQLGVDMFYTPPTSAKG